jgi:hypothetical protein
LHHFTILFVIIALTLFISSDIKTNNLVAVVREKEILDQNFNRAIDNAATYLVEVEGMNSLTINKEKAVNVFFNSIYSTLNITDNPEKQTLIKNYVPVIVVTCEDGYYIYYTDEYIGSDHYSYFNKRWSEKIPFYYEDNDFIYSFTLTDKLTLYDKNGLLDVTKEETIFTIDYHELSISKKYKNFREQKSEHFLLNEEKFNLIRKNTIISSIENSLTYYCNKHNNIAHQFGITYNFAMPTIDNSDWVRSIDNPSIMVMFQGYPYGVGVGGTYNRFDIAGSIIKKGEMYYIEQKEWYYLYHKEGCQELKKTDSIVFLNEPYYSVSDCAKKGAYACKICIPNGVRVPEYNP